VAIEVERGGEMAERRSGDGEGAMGEYPLPATQLLHGRSPVHGRRQDARSVTF
jgi:hypothetical protein